MRHSMWKRFWGLERYRALYLKRAPAGPMADLYAGAFPPRGAPVARVEFVAVDFETTALDPRDGEIVSAGWVTISGLVIDYATARYMLVRPDRPVGADSAVIHGIRDSDLAGAVSPRTFLAALLADLSGRVLLAHNAVIEMAFLRAACLRWFDFPFELRAADTVSASARSRFRAACCGWARRANATICRATGRITR